MWWAIATESAWLWRNREIAVKYGKKRSETGEKKMQVLMYNRHIFDILKKDRRQHKYVQGDSIMAQDTRKKKKRISKKRRQYQMITGICMAVMLAIIVALLCVGNSYYKKHFIKGTFINDIDVSDMDVDGLESRMRAYELKIRERTKTGGYITEVITGDQIGVTVGNMEEVSQILQQQNIFKAIFRTLAKKTQHYQIGQLYRYVDEALERAIDGLQGFSEEFWEPPVDATLTEYIPETGYQIVPESQGNQLKEAQTRQAIKEAVDGLVTEIDPEALGLYEEPTVYRDDERLIALLPQLKKYTDVVINYQFGETTERIDGSLIDTWLIVDEDTFQVRLSREAVDEFVVSLRKKYDTIFRDRSFMTSYGKTVTVSGGDYGWWMDYSKEQQELYDMLERGESGERTPVYYQTAAAYGSRDYGDTYVEVNLTAQHLFLYVDGVKVLESDFVSGNAARQFDTPEGVYGITYKEQDAVLVGEDYETPVSFWMPFNGNIGLHDAIWRDAFGADLYLTRGSHGCINLPYRVAKDIYRYVSKGTAVICYHLSGTERAETTPQSEIEKAQSVIDAIEKIGEVTKDSGKRIERARQLYKEISSEARGYVTNYAKLEAAEETFQKYKK